MSKLSEFLGQPREVEIEGKTLKLHPLRTKDLASEKIANLQENSGLQKQLEASKELIRRSLRDDKVTDEEIENLPQRVFNKLLEEITKFNGLGQDERVGKIKKKIAEQQKSK